MVLLPALVVFIVLLQLNTNPFKGTDFYPSLLVDRFPAPSSDLLGTVCFSVAADWWMWEEFKGVERTLSSYDRGMWLKMENSGCVSAKEQTFKCSDWLLEVMENFKVFSFHEKTKHSQPSCQIPNSSSFLSRSQQFRLCDCQWTRQLGHQEVWLVIPNLIRNLWCWSFWGDNLWPLPQLDHALQGKSVLKIISASWSRVERPTWWPQKSAWKTTCMNCVGLDVFWVCWVFPISKMSSLVCSSCVCSGLCFILALVLS